MTAPQGIPGPCPLCGAVSIAPITQRSILLAVCDVLVLKALERLGGFIVRAKRGRYHETGGQPKYVMHTRWRPDEKMVSKALAGAWDVVPALLDTHGCCDVSAAKVSDMLDSYVSDLAITGTAHTMEELMFRFEGQLALPVFDLTVTSEADSP